MALLDYTEMIRLAVLFEQWAFEEELDPEQRTKVLLWAVDYEALAEFVGPTWKASDPNPDETFLNFVARIAFSGAS